MNACLSSIRKKLVILTYIRACGRKSDTCMCMCHDIYGSVTHCTISSLRAWPDWKRVRAARNAYNRHNLFYIHAFMCICMKCRSWFAASSMQVSVYALYAVWVLYEWCVCVNISVRVLCVYVYVIWIEYYRRSTVLTVYFMFFFDHFRSKRMLTVIDRAVFTLVYGRNNINKYLD